MDRVFSFLLWLKREARGPWKQGRKTRGSITCCTDRANEANKMFIIWLCWLFRFWKGDGELEVRTATYGPEIDQSQHVKSVSHIILMHIKLNSSLVAKKEKIFLGSLLYSLTVDSLIVHRAPARHVLLWLKRLPPDFRNIPYWSGCVSWFGNSFRFGLKCKAYCIYSE